MQFIFLQPVAPQRVDRFGSRNNLVNADSNPKLMGTMTGIISFNISLIALL